MEETGSLSPRREQPSNLSNVKYTGAGLHGKPLMHSATDSELAAQRLGGNGKREGPSLVLVGTSFRTADLDTREEISRILSGGSDFFQSISGIATEASVLETCNRLEFYLVSAEPEKTAAALLGRFAGADIPESSFYVRTGLDAIKHLFRVASGLDSLVAGEEQILQQVRDAGRAARASGQARSVLPPLFDAAYSSGRRVRESYNVPEANRSVSAFALKRALRELGRAPAEVLLIGSGETAKLAALRLRGSKVYLLSSRRDLRERFPNAVRIGRGRLEVVSARCDLIIAATKHRGFVLRRRDVPDSRRAIILDLGFPRNVDPAIKRSRLVRLYDLDDIASWARSARREGLLPAERAAEEEARRFNSWLTASRLTPTLANIFRWAERVRDEETAAALRKLPELTPHQRTVVEALSKRLTGKLLSPHTSFVKEAGMGGDQQERLQLLDEIFRDGSN